MIVIYDLIYSHSTLEYAVDLETAEVCMTFTLISCSLSVCVGRGVHPFLSRVYRGGKTLPFTHRMRSFFTVRTFT